MSKAMNGSTGYPMSERIKSGIEVHGLAWAFDYYVYRHGFTEWEFILLAGLNVNLIIDLSE